MNKNMKRKTRAVRKMEGKKERRLIQYIKKKAND